MNKNELMHLHALLCLIMKDAVEHGDASRAHFAPYSALATSPVAFRARRDDHEEAVLTLSRLLATAMAQEPTSATERTTA
ncbi:UPF0058 family protein [Haloferacaceae archaeon DSL9]